jgi:hypothetical protein
MGYQYRKEEKSDSLPLKGLRPLICKQTNMESSLTAALMKYGSDIQLKEKQKEILEYVYLISPIRILDD